LYVKKGIKPRPDFVLDEIEDASLPWNH